MFCLGFVLIKLYL